MHTIKVRLIIRVIGRCIKRQSLQSETTGRRVGTVAPSAKPRQTCAHAAGPPTTSAQSALRASVSLCFACISETVSRTNSIAFLLPIQLPCALKLSASAF